MRRLYVLVVMGLLVGQTGFGESADGDVKFTEFGSKEGKFTCLMPGKPTQANQKAGEIDLKIFVSEVRDGAFLVGYADLLAGTQYDLSAGVKGIVNAAGGTNLKEKDCKFGDVTGKEFEFAVTKPAKGFASGRLFVLDGRLYECLAMGKNYDLANADVQKFLKSFKVTK